VMHQVVVPNWPGAQTVMMSATLKGVPKRAKAPMNLLRGGRSSMRC
jgi:hypothetical protein